MRTASSARQPAAAAPGGVTGPVPAQLPIARHAQRPAADPPGPTAAAAAPAPGAAKRRPPAPPPGPPAVLGKREQAVRRLRRRRLRCRMVGFDWQLPPQLAACEPRCLGCLLPCLGPGYLQSLQLGGAAADGWWLRGRLQGARASAAARVQPWQGCLLRRSGVAC